MASTTSNRSTQQLGRTGVAGGPEFRRRASLSRFATPDGPEVACARPVSLGKVVNVVLDLNAEPANEAHSYRG